MGKVSDAPEIADDVVRGHLARATSETARWPEDAEVIAALETRDMYYAVTQARIVMVLRAIEASQYGPKVDIPSIPHSLSIEHVMPQRWESHWMPHGLSPAEEDSLREARASRVHKLGNLTLTAGPMNTALSNSAWSDKQPELNRGSKLLLNAELLERYAGGFDERAIDERSTLLAKRVCEIWPRPDAV